MVEEGIRRVREKRAAWLSENRIATTMVTATRRCARGPTSLIIIFRSLSRDIPAKRFWCRDQDSHLGYCGHNARSWPLDDHGWVENIPIVSICKERVVGNCSWRISAERARSYQYVYHCNPCVDILVDGQCKLF